MLYRAVFVARKPRGTRHANPRERAISYGRGATSKNNPLPTEE